MYRCNVVTFLLNTEHKQFFTPIITLDPFVPTDTIPYHNLFADQCMPNKETLTINGLYIL